jgi:DNA-binding NarL/FixJ family response regulator
MPLESGPILVVDDDAETRALAAGALRRLGYSAREVATGEGALDAVHQERPLLVVLEVRLPDTSGYEICRELRDEFGDGLPIIFVSKVRTEPSDQVAGFLVGADDYIAKPFAADELLARVRRLLARSKPSPSAMVAGLTKREHEVLSLLAEGFPQPEIASRLSVSPKTVGKHIERVLRKLAFTAGPKPSPSPCAPVSSEAAARHPSRGAPVNYLAVIQVTRKKNTPATAT